jgi:hypothetical protein
MVYLLYELRAGARSERESDSTHTEIEPKNRVIQ